jgi:hypothetical protein
MLNRKKKKPRNTIPLTVPSEMVQPRTSKSARIAELKLDTSRISEQPRSVMPGTVSKLIPSPGRSRPEKAQISIEGADRGYRKLRFENSLTDEHGDEVKLKKGAHVEVTVEAKDTKPRWLTK